jgi:hypothetical protein
MGCIITYLGFHWVDFNDSKADSALILSITAIASARITVQGHRQSREMLKAGFFLDFYHATINHLAGS